jgi:hypothetical protein
MSADVGCAAMALKIGDRPTVRLPTFEIERPRVTDKFPSFVPNTNSTFQPAAGPGPMVMPQLPPNPASIPGYGTPDALKDVFEQVGQLPGFQAGATQEARTAALEQARDTLIAAGRERGLDLMLNKKANGQLSLDAFAWRKPDGEVAIIDFALASKDLNQATKMQWLDVTNGGGAAGGPNLFEMPDMINGIFDDIVKTWSNQPGFKAGASEGDRKKTLGKIRDSLIKAGRAAGLDLALNKKDNGEISLDAIVWRKPDGTQTVIDFAKASKDLNQDISLQWLNVGGPGNYTPLE